MNDKAVSLQFKNSITNLKKLEQYEQRLLSLKKTMDSMPSDLKVDAIGDKQSQNNKELNNSVKVVNALSKGFREVIANFSKYTSKTADFVENINLMNVAFHRTEESMDEASLAGTKLVNTLAEMYGMDESNLTRTVGIFKQLANAMNLSDSVGTKLSETLTQLTIDSASLYNLSFERASSVLQSALAG